MVALVVVARGEARVTLWLVADPGRREPALAHGLGHALSHQERDLPPELAAATLDVGRRFAALGDAKVPTDRAAGALVALAAAATPPLTLVRRRLLAARPRLPRWPLRLRIGAPSPARLWPFDAELAGLHLGLRRIVKREPVDPAEVAADRAWLEGQGAIVREQGGVLFAGRAPADLEDAIAAERALAAGGAEAAHAALALGEALGYPRCCTAAFARLGGRDDPSLALALLPGPPWTPSPPETQWLVGALALVSHVPCSLECAATRALGARLLAALDGAAPGFAARWLGLARRLQAVDAAGRCYALDVDGDLDGGPAFVRHAVELGLPVREDLSDVAREAPELVGCRLAGDDAGIAATGDPFRAVLAADHRGAAS